MNAPETNSHKSSAAFVGREWTHRDLVEGRCTTEQYVADMKACVDARFAAEIERKYREGKARASWFIGRDKWSDLYRAAVKRV